MDFAKKQLAILYIDIDKAYFVSMGVVLEITFPSDVVSDLDILNKEKLQQLLFSFIEDNKLTPCSVAIVFSTATLFQKEISLDNIKLTKEEEIGKFVELVPFEEVLSKTYTINQKTIVVALNKQMYEVIRVVFEKKNFSVLCVTPYSIIQELIPELASNVDFTLMQTKIDILKQFSFITENQTNVQGKEKNKGETTSLINDKNRVYVLGGVFGILFVLLVILVIETLHPFPEKSTGPKILPPISPIQKVSPVPVKTSTSTGSANIIPTSASPSGITTK